MVDRLMSNVTLLQRCSQGYNSHRLSQRHLPPRFFAEPIRGSADCRTRRECGPRRILFVDKAADFAASLPVGLVFEPDAVANPLKLKMHRYSPFLSGVWITPALNL